MYKKKPHPRDIVERFEKAVDRARKWGEPIPLQVAREAVELLDKHVPMRRGGAKPWWQPAIEKLEVASAKTHAKILLREDRERRAAGLAKRGEKPLTAGKANEKAAEGAAETSVTGLSVDEILDRMGRKSLTHER